jgi:hypothetical protein
VKVIAIIRHPIPTLLSWQNCQIALSHGRLSAGYRFWADAQEIRDACLKLLEMQARIYDLYCARYRQYGDWVVVLRYEDMIRNPYALEEITGQEFRLRPLLRSQNTKRSSATAASKINEIKAIVAANCYAAQHFYPDFACW